VIEAAPLRSPRKKTIVEWIIANNSGMRSSALRQAKTTTARRYRHRAG
jgi:hypothetical protein